jgi:Na+-transporting NADH:ubiquinone oxidoreductase subunit F
MLEIFLGVVAFTAIVLVLTLFVLGARRVLVPSGECTIKINGTTEVVASIGGRLLDVLNRAGVSLPTACGGTGTCGLCKARVTEGGGEAGPQEIALLSRSESAKQIRLACQVPVLSTMNVEVDEIYFGVKTWQCTILSVRNVATLISEIVLKLPEGEETEFRPGSFVQVTCPPYQLDYSQLKVDRVYRDVWDKSNLWSLRASASEPTTRAYSVANKPGDSSVISLNVRIALPPVGANIPPGIVSSWLYSLKPGDRVEVTGPYGLFFVEPTDKEAIFIGGGVGMAPLYAQITDLLDAQHSNRKISYWYGARSKRELYYDEEFERLQSKYDNFSWQVALSEPEPNDHWEGHTGFIHKVILDTYLGAHAAPEDCEYYLCGPPLMVKAVLATLDNLGVDAESIHYDDFGAG